jgi:hypothetical protein
MLVASGQASSVAIGLLANDLLESVLNEGMGMV